MDKVCTLSLCGSVSRTNRAQPYQCTVLFAFCLLKFGAKGFICRNVTSMHAWTQFLTVPFLPFLPAAKKSRGPRRDKDEFEKSLIKALKPVSRSARTAPPKTFDRPDEDWLTGQQYWAAIQLVKKDKYDKLQTSKDASDQELLWQYNAAFSNFAGFVHYLGASVPGFSPAVACKVLKDWHYPDWQLNLMLGNGESSFAVGSVSYVVQC